MTLSDILLDYITKNRGTSYVNLQDVAEKAGYEVHGDNASTHEQYPNVIFWAGISDVFADAIASLYNNEQIKHRPASLLVYMVDGRTLKFPLVKKLKDYKTPHWCPVVLVPA